MFIRMKTPITPFQAWRRMTISVALAVALVAGCQGAPAKKVEGDDRPTPTKPTAVVAAEGDCPVVPAKLVEEVRRLYEAEPEAMNKKQGLSGWEDVHAVVAKRHGLTVHDPRSALGPLNDDLGREEGDPRPGLSTQDHMDVVNAFARQYGVDVRLLTSDADMSAIPFRWGYQPVAISKLSADDVYKMRVSIGAVAEGLGRVPVELVRRSGLKHVYLVQGDKSLVASAQPGPPERRNPTILVHVGRDVGVLDPLIFGHEITHLLEEVWCGYMLAIDPGFESLSPGNIYDHKDGVATIAGVDYFTEESTLGDSAQGIAYGDKWNANQLIWTSLGSTPAQREKARKELVKLRTQVVAMYNYSLTDIGEDKATIGEWILASDESYHSRVRQYGRGDRVNNKIVYLTARLFQSDPAIARFIIDSKGCMDELQKRTDKGDYLC